MPEHPLLKAMPREDDRDHELKEPGPLEVETARPEPETVAPPRVPTTREGFPEVRLPSLPQVRIPEAPRPRPISERIEGESGRQSITAVEAGYNANSKDVDDLADVEAALVKALAQKKDAKNNS